MNYDVLVADEAIEDIGTFVSYIHRKLYNPDAAEKIYHNLKREIDQVGNFPMKFSDSGIGYRGYVIHKKVYKTYLIFYTIDDEKRKVYVLRVLKDLMNWRIILRQAKIYHFSNYDKFKGKGLGFVPRPRSF